MDLPGYRNFREIFRGARCVVLRANRLGDGAPVVIKSVLADRPAMSRAAALLANEYEILSTLHFAAIVKPLALEAVAGMPALVLADAGPENLHDWLRRRAVGTDVFLDLAVQIAKIVAYLY